MYVQNSPTVRPEASCIAGHNSATIVIALILAGLGASLVARASGSLGSVLWGRTVSLATGSTLLILAAMATICCCTLSLAHEGTKRLNDVETD
jgi:hypothetical protein